MVKKQARTGHFTNRKTGPEAGLDCGSGDFKGYVAISANYVYLLGGPDNRSAYRAYILDAAILAGRAASLDRGRGFAIVLVIISLGLNLHRHPAAGSNIIHAGLLASHSAVSAVNVVTVHP